MTPRRDVNFTSQGLTLHARHFSPEGLPLASKAGAVVMAHGLSMTSDSGLDPFAERFAAAGLHVLVFDYRGFGDSEGTPRELVSARQQVEDYGAAFAFARTLPGVDASRVALWGTSYSGGIALQCAYEHPEVRALVLQVPNLDNAATARFMTQRLVQTDPRRGLWIIKRAVLDSLAGTFGRPAVYAQAIGRTGEQAAYISDEGRSLVDEIRGPAWKNRIALRDFARLPMFRPLRHVPQVRCPIMIVVAERDDLTPTGPAFRAAKMATSEVELLRFPVGHFGVYTGETFRENVARQVAFLQRALGA